MMKEQFRYLTPAGVLIVAGLLGLPARTAHGFSCGRIEGKENFGAYVSCSGKVDWEGALKKSTFKLEPQIGIKAFGERIEVISALLQAGNYSDYDTLEWNDLTYDPVRSGAWVANARLRLFGVSLWSRSSRFHHHDYNILKLADKGGWNRQEFPTPPLPIGPVTIRGSAGYSINYKLASDFEWDAAKSAASYTTGPQASIGGSVKGYVDAVLLRGGLGGDINFVEGFYGLSYTQPMTSVRTGSVNDRASMEFLNGRVYAFVESRSVKCCYKVNWKRILDVSLVDWDGIQRQWSGVVL